MPGPSLVESRLWESVTAPPADGDDVAITAGTGPLRPNVLQKLYARESYLFNGPFHGFVDPAYQADITASGTNRTWTLRTAKRLSITRDDTSGIIDTFVVGGTPVSVAIGVLGANDEAFVYAYNDAGTLKLEVSGTLPEPSLDFKDSDTTRVYLGSFRTDGAGRAVPQVQCGRRYRVLAGHSGITGTPLLCGSTTADGVLAVAARAPSTAKSGHFALTAGKNAAPTASRAVGIGAVGTNAGALLIRVENAEVWIYRTAAVDLPIIGGQIEISTSKVSELFAEASCLGWEE